MKDENIKTIAILIYKKVKGTANADELAELGQWVNSHPKNKAWLDKVSHPQYIPNAVKTIESVDSDSIREKMLKKMSRSSLRRT